MNSKVEVPDERRSRRIRDSLRGLREYLPHREVRHGGRWLFYCAIVGAAAGLGAVLFDLISLTVLHYAIELLAGWDLARPGGGERPLFAPSGGHRNPWILALVPAVGGLLSGALVAWLAPEAAGHGTDEVIGAYHQRGGFLRLRASLVKIVASGLTLGSGGSGGREGPIAQIGAGFGSFIATRLRLGENDRRVLLAAGMGAGIGSIFRAPLGGALFAAEVLYSSTEFEPSVLMPACVSSIAGYSVFTAIRGTGTLFATPAFRFDRPVELATYFVLAIVLAVYGFLYVNGFYGAHRLFARLRFPRILKPALGGLCTGAIAVAALGVSGREESLSILGFSVDIVQKVLDAPYPALLGPGLLAMVALGKILATSTTVGSGGSGGLFGPSIFIGGCVGGAVGLALHAVFPGVVAQPAAYVIVGMAGFVAGVAKTPIAALIMVSEISGSYSLLIPCTWVCVVTMAMSTRWHLFHLQVPARADSPAHRGRDSRALETE